MINYKHYTKYDGPGAFASSHSGEAADAFSLRETADAFGCSTARMALEEKRAIRKLWRNVSRGIKEGRKGDLLK